MNHSYYVSINADKCRGCKTCEMACSTHHFKESNPTRSRIRGVTEMHDGVLYSAPVVCQQCEDPVCQAVCPFDAIYKSHETGAKLVDETKCVGCRRCVYACPFGGTMVDEQTKISTKCVLCDGDPQCVKFCPFGALDYVRSDKMDASRKRKAVQAVLEAKHNAPHSNSHS